MAVFQLEVYKIRACRAEDNGSNCILADFHQFNNSKITEKKFNAEEGLFGP